MNTLAQGYKIQWEISEIKRGEIGELKSITYKGKHEGENILINMSVENLEAGKISINLPKKLQGQGFSAKYLDAVLDLLEANGVNKITFKSSFEVGGYAWASFGFVATKKADVEAIYNLAKGLISKKELMELKTIIDNYYKKFPDGKAFSMKNIAEMPYGKELLKGTVWEASLDLKNPEMLQVVRKNIKDKIERSNQ